MIEIPDKLYFKIGEVADITDVKPYVLRYWENEFRIISPRKSNSNQRVYTKKDIELILEIKRLLYKEKYTLEGAKKRVRELRSMSEEERRAESAPGPDDLKDSLRTIRTELDSIRKLLVE